MKGLNVKNKFYFNSKTQFENFGDAIISRELLKLAKTKGEIHLLSINTPEDFLKIIDDQSYIKHRNIFSFIFSILFSLFKKGNVYYLLNPGGFGGGVNKKELVKQNIIIFIYAILNLCGVKLMRLGASLTNLSPRKGKLESIKSKYIYYNSYRDQLSMDIAYKNNIRTNDCFPDMAFLIEKKATKNLNQDKKIVLSFRDRKGSNIYDAINNNLIELKLIKEKSSQYKFLFSSQVDFDKVFNAKLKDLFIKNKFNADEIDFEEKNQYFDLYQTSELVISNRLHVLLFALVSGTKVVALVEKEHDQKIIGIFKDLGFDNLICDVNSIRDFDWKSIDSISYEFVEKQINLKKEEIYRKFGNIIELIE